MSKIVFKEIPKLHGYKFGRNCRYYGKPNLEFQLFTNCNRIRWKFSEVIQKLKYSESERKV